MDITPEKDPHVKYPSLAAMATAAALAASLASCTQEPMRTGGRFPDPSQQKKETSSPLEQGLIGTPCVGSPAKPTVTLEDIDSWNRDDQRIPGRKRRVPTKPSKEDIPPVDSPLDQALGGAQVVD